MSCGCRSSYDAVDICDASPADAREIWELQKAAFYKQAILYNDFTLPPLIQTIDELENDFQKYHFLKALYQGKIVGSVRGAVTGATCAISRLIVHPDHQNNGIGRKLMHAIEHKFSDVQRYELFTGHRSEKSLALYGKLGYHEFARKRESESVTLVCLEKLRVEIF